MPIADLLGVTIDMQLLGKLTLSVATMLFITMVFGFYHARARNRRRGQRDAQVTQEGYNARNNEQEPESEAAKDESKEKQSSEKHLQESPKKANSAIERFQPETTDLGSCAKEKRSSEEPSQDQLTDGKVKNAQMETVDLDICAKEKMSSETPVQESFKNANGEVERSDPETMNLDSFPKEIDAGDSNKTEDVCTIEDHTNHKVNNGKLSLTIPTPDGIEKGPESPNGQRSPCLLEMLDGGTGVGRELRQDLGLEGMFSSFQSKAEIKMENANLFLDGPGYTTGVQGKIYDYYIESSSQFISDVTPVQSRSVTPVFGQTEKSNLFKSQSLDLPKFKERSRTPSPSRFIIKDLEITPRFTNEPPPVFKPECVRSSRQPVIRQDSYLTAADSELPMPVPPHTDRSYSHLQFNDSHLRSQDSDIANTDTPEEAQVETVAGAKFLHLAENMGNAELESLAGKLDLGNCMEALALAKKHGHVALQTAALQVMSDNFLQVLRDPLLFGRLKAGERDHIQTQRMTGRKWLVVADIDADWRRQLTVSQSESVKTPCGMYCYDDYKDTWHLHCHIPQEVLSKGCAMCTMDNYLFITVGFQGLKKPSKKVYCYNPVTSIWSEISPMNEARPHCKLVALQGHLYAIGGECLASVERYDPRTNRWTFVAPLPNETFAVAHRATACNGELFVAGGTLRYTLLRYNPKTNTWRESMIVGSKDRTAEMVALRNFLYRFDISALGISVYRYHAMARIWYECSSIRLPHCTAFQCVTVDNIIYCVSRQFTLRFLADEVSPSFVAKDLKVLNPVRGILFPLVLVLPDSKTPQTQV
ncbi:Kelch domain-containing protein 7A [Triplophysa tibetana]|uniref:Kelch domain-containing protein 7A n=1 Tax=Triplophysa tibetana TaxID=1572043 RepID=A0A5A9NCA0_9TELE|nr:Kelch domain-containing protein 7A [Triplophysa tibetana]